MGPPKATYTDEQLEAYLHRTEYPRTNDTVTLLQDIRQKIQTDALGTLSDLQRRHLAAIPWGNSELHYSQYQTISLDPKSLFDKIVERRLDGYYAENSALFLIVLRSLGYHV